MADLLRAVAAAAGVFAGTNVDDLIVLTVFYLASRASGRPRPWHIWAGQYAGIGALVAVSMAAALGLALVPDRWVPLLGLVPVALGVRGLVRRPASGDDDATVMAGNAITVAGVTIANGADNIAVYTPLFRSIGVNGTALTVTVFAVLVAVWCLTASWLGSHRRVIEAVERYGRWLVPLVFIAIGAVILSGLG